MERLPAAAVTKPSLTPTPFLTNATDTPAPNIGHLSMVYSSDMSTDERFGFILTEVLRLRTQVSSLQAQLAELSHERDSTTLLIWTEVTRLAQQLEQVHHHALHSAGAIENKLRGRASALPTRQHSAYQPDDSDELMTDEQTRGCDTDKFTDPVIRTLLGESAGCNEAGTANQDAISGISSNETSSKEAYENTKPRTQKRRTRNGEEIGSRYSSLSLQEQPLPRNGAHNSVGTGETSETGQDATSDQMIDQWLQIQRNGEKIHPELAQYTDKDPRKEWFCHVCHNVATDGGPGDHFCWSRSENDQKDGLKVFCHYCKKGTSRMPDLRVHFRKIVYCRLIRRELKKAYLKMDLRNGEGDGRSKLSIQDTQDEASTTDMAPLD